MFDLLLSLLIIVPLVVLNFGIPDNRFGPLALSLIAIPTGVLMAHHQILWTTLNSRSLFLGIIGLEFCMWRRRWEWGTVLKDLKSNVAASSALVFGSIVPVAFPYLTNGSITRGAPFSNSNNDLAIYIISADNFQHAGFKEFGRVISYQAGAMANFEVAGAASWVAWLSRLTGLPVWRTTNIAMLLIIALTAIALYRLTIVFISSKYMAVGISLLAMWMPFSRLAQQNYFLSQAISRLCLVLAVYGLVLVWKGKFAGSSVITVATITSLVTYPAGSISSLIILLAILSALSVSSLVGRKRLSEVLRCTSISVLSMGLGVATVFGRWNLIWGNIKWYSKPGVTGWTLYTRDLASWFGIPRAIEGQVFYLVALAILISLFGCCIVLFLRSFRQRTEDLTTVLILLVLFASYAALSLKIGSDTYQTWKYLVTIQPLLVVFGLIPIAVFAKGVLSRLDRFPIAVIVSGALCLVCLLSYNALQSRLMYTSNYQVPTMELEEAANSEIVQQHPNLLVQLNPYLETMIAPIILDIHEAVYASDTYIGPATGSDSLCTLRRKSGRRGENPVSIALVLSPANICD